MEPLRGSMTCPTSQLVNETWLFTWMMPPQGMCFWLLHLPRDLPQVRFADCACLFINVTITAHSSVSHKDLDRVLLAADFHYPMINRTSWKNYVLGEDIDPCHIATTMPLEMLIPQDFCIYLSIGFK